MITLPNAEAVMGFVKFFTKNLVYIVSKETHLAEIAKLEAALREKDATIEQKDATIQTQEKMVEFMKEKAESAESERLSIDIYFNKLNANIASLVTDRPPTIELIANSTANVTSAVSFSESLKRSLLDITGASVNVDDMDDMLDVINEDDNRGT